jgi:hypothetical protein
LFAAGDQETAAKYLKRRLFGVIRTPGNILQDNGLRHIFGVAQQSLHRG